MKELCLLSALTGVNGAYIAEAAPKEKNRRKISYIASIAACLLLVLTAVGLVRFIIIDDTDIFPPHTFRAFTGRLRPSQCQSRIRSG